MYTLHGHNLRFAIVCSYVLPYHRVLEVGGALRLRLEAKEIGL